MHNINSKSVLNVRGVHVAVVSYLGLSVFFFFFIAYEKNHGGLVDFMM